LTAEDKALLWKMRHMLTGTPSALPKLLRSVDWTKPLQKAEAHRLLAAWTPPARPEAALELLGVSYADYVVRRYAVNALNKLSDEKVKLFLPQLIQCLKLEAYHDSPLSRWLLERAIGSPLVVGHFFFWSLKAEMHSPAVTERFGVLMEQYLLQVPHEAIELHKQNQALLRLQRVAELIVRLKRSGLSDEQADQTYQAELEKLNRDLFEALGSFRVPYNPSLVASRLRVDECKFMNSKMRPLWLSFDNAEEDSKEPIVFIFKSGDDLRQDIVTLQLLAVMDSLWLANDLNLKLSPYSVVATGVNSEGKGVGVIEVVAGLTKRKIQVKYGGGVLGALKKEPIHSYIKASCDGKSKESFGLAVDNFTSSCAGYAVATYVLGIGDRHAGNIMVKQDGEMFHIDFGHFLGNFKSKAGWDRERSAFVFSPDMAYVLSTSDKFPIFYQKATEAFRVLREDVSLLEILFLNMVPAGMPELMVREDIFYMRDRLYLGVSWDQAVKLFHKEVRTALNEWYRPLDDAIGTIKQIIKK
jgi:phosphatidylinositol-4,5-bisphosphate 3-kinase